jgi:diguanylate cyclase (GGDEF)-like protein
MKTHAIPNPQLTHFFKPVEPTETPTYEVDLSATFRDVLERANEFVPSEAGVVWIKDSSSELKDTTVADEDIEDIRPVEFVAASAFGSDGERLAGARRPIDMGIAGRVYRTGDSHVCAAQQDVLLDELSDLGIELRVRSVIAVPLYLREEIVGVLELLNQRTELPLGDHDLALLSIFAQTISTAIAYAFEAQRSKEMARRDDLTRLYNDRYMHYSLTQTLDAALRDGHDCGLVFFDLDHFKTVNDTHGHLAGSRVLHEMGDLLRAVLPGPALPARYGGDEFVIILPGSTHQESFWVAETIRKTVERHVFLDKPDPEDPVNYPSHALHITASVGLAMLVDDTILAFPDAAGDWNVQMVKNEFLRRADTRMYRAKEGGRNHTIASDADLAVGASGSVNSR